MMDNILIKDVKSGDLVWECEQGQDALLLALSDARREDHGIAVTVAEVLTGKVFRLFSGNSAYGPRLYTSPQYTRPDWQALILALVRLLKETCDTSLEQAAIREKGLQQAATEYSESRDMWKQRHTLVQQECVRLHAIIDEVRAIVARPANGIDMQGRVEAYLDKELGHE